MTLVPGDATFSVATLGDQVLQDVADPGRVLMSTPTSALAPSGELGVGNSWFSLWTPRTALDLFSAGGNLTPLTASIGTDTDLAIVYPSIVRVAAAHGSLYYGKAIVNSNAANSYAAPLLLAPSPNAQLQWLAGDSIYAGGFTIGQSGAAAGSMATPFKPAYLALDLESVVDRSPGRQFVQHGGAGEGRYISAVRLRSRFGRRPGNSGTQAARIYAVQGDLIGVNAVASSRSTTPSMQASPGMRVRNRSG